MSARRRSNGALLAATVASLGLALTGCGAPLDAASPAKPDDAYDPRADALVCLHEDGLGAEPSGRDAILLTGRAAGARIVFTSNVGAATDAEIAGRAEGAERIGLALLFLQGAPPRIVERVETCLDDQAPKGTGGGTSGGRT